MVLSSSRQTCARQTCVEPDFAVRCSTRPIYGMHRLGGTFLVGASLSGADLRGAYLRLAKLDGANLYDANLDGFDGLRRDQVNRAHCNSGTKLLVGLTGWKMSND